MPDQKLGKDAETECNKVHAEDLMIIAAFRYSLGRSSYIVPACVDWLKLNWNKLDTNARSVILRDLKDAIQENRAGQDFDKEKWKELIEWDAQLTGLKNREE